MNSRRSTTKRAPSQSVPVFLARVYAVVRRIPPGRVMTYGDVARAAGYPGAARAVGTAMRKNPHSFVTPRHHLRVPCHRVVRADGALGEYAGGVSKKRQLLLNEGVRFIGQRISPIAIKKI